MKKRTEMVKKSLQSPEAKDRDYRIEGRGQVMKMFARS
jgi:hypothetical protein